MVIKHPLLIFSALLFTWKASAVVENNQDFQVEKTQEENLDTKSFLGDEEKSKENSSFPLQKEKVLRMKDKFNLREQVLDVEDDRKKKVSLEDIINPIPSLENEIIEEKDLNGHLMFTDDEDAMQNGPESYLRHGTTNKNEDDLIVEDISSDLNVTGTYGPYYFVNTDSYRMPYAQKYKNGYSGVGAIRSSYYDLMKWYLISTKYNDKRAHYIQNYVSGRFLSYKNGRVFAIKGSQYDIDDFKWYVIPRTYNERRSYIFKHATTGGKLYAARGKTLDEGWGIYKGELNADQWWYSRSASE